ncbi:Holliday junction resolvase RuvX [Enterovirga sp.]|jgi:putative Holliday junction resolvase|uniref:Holliday junction resolvase RuvX n=1 Tax=Enterovirga sp. TaxID=2026350 RepID=UPI0026317EDC|nr:Holliday junction resolvase RuvX [Enterovirga sp.]MDB5592180.1 Holliday junction resolvase RuvX [Enterovirga sp.]
MPAEPLEILRPVSEDVLDILTALPRGRRLLGFDLGTKTIGLAMSDVERCIATPLETIQRSKFSAEAARVQELAARFDIGGFVFGLPVNMDGTEGPRAQSARAFARNLARLAPLPCAFWDERLSTAAVTRAMIDADTTRARRAIVVDRVAAAYILQGFLDRLRARSLQL